MVINSSCHQYDIRPIARGLSALKQVTQAVVLEKNFGKKKVEKKGFIKNSNLTNVYLPSHLPSLRNASRKT